MIFNERNGKNVEQYIISNLSISLNHIENVYQYFKNLLDNEKDISVKERDIMCTYSLKKMEIDFVRLVNIKKSLKAIMENKIIRETKSIDNFSPEPNN